MGALSICPFTIPFSPAVLTGRKARLSGVRSGEADDARISPPASGPFVPYGWIRTQQSHSRSVLSAAARPLPWNVSLRTPTGALASSA